MCVNAKGQRTKFRAKDALLVSFGVTNDVVTIDLSEGKPNQRYVLECTTDLNVWVLLSPVRLSAAGDFYYEYTCAEPNCFYRVVPGK